MLFMLGAAEWIQVGQLIGVIATTGIQVAQTIAIRNLLNNITNGAWLLEQARKWGMYFDKILINYSDMVYGYFQQIVKGTLITPSVTKELLSRIYIVIGIIIFFRLAMVAMKYMMNPEQFLDDKLGVQTLVKRAIIGSALIILIPTIFNTANKLQGYIIEDKIIEKVILPKDAYVQLTKAKNPGKELAMTVFQGFFSWNEAVPHDSAGKVYRQYERAIEYKNMNSFDDKNMTKKVGDEYVISYVPIISTLAVGYLLFMLVKYAMEVAFRSLKLVFMQLISPFVIVNYMLDPSKEETMKKWTNITVSTYLMIFIRVITLWFASLICYYLKNGIPLSSGETSLLNSNDNLLKALIILAVFAFLKDLPKIISEVFGYNLQENETISGIMSKGVGVLKGFAMGKVGLGFAKKQMGYNIASSLTGGAANTLGAFNRGRSDALKDGATKGQANLAGLAGAGNMLGSAGAGVTSIMGQTLSSSMGSTILSPISQAGGIAANAEKSAPGHIHYNPSNDKKNDEEKPNISVETSNQMFNNVMNNPQLQRYVEGETISLMDQNSTLVEGAKIENEVVNALSGGIHQQLENNNISVSREEVTSRVKELRNDHTLGIDFNKCDADNINTIMNKVYSDISAAASAATPAPNPSPQPAQPSSDRRQSRVVSTDDNGLESITRTPPSA